MIRWNLFRKGREQSDLPEIELNIPMPEMRSPMTEEELEDRNSFQLSGLQEEILAVLLDRQERDGFDILRKLNEERKSKRGSTLGYSRLYPVLGKLEKQGLICSRLAEERDELWNARTKYYQIAAPGIIVFKERQSYIHGLVGGQLAL